MLKTELSKEQVLFLSESVWHLFQMDELKKGLALYKQGNVYNVSITESHVHGSVLDSVDHYVAIDLDFFQVSTCTCKFEVCKHKAALFFYMYSAYDNADVLLTKWQINHASAINRSKASSTTSHIRAPLIKSVSIAPPNPDSVKDWHRFFDEAFQQRIDQRSSYQDIYTKYLVSYTYNSLKHISDPTLKGLYDVHALVDTMYRILNHVQPSTTPDYLTFRIGPILQELLDELLDVLKVFDHLHKQQMYDKHLEESIPYFNKLLFQPKSQPDYRLLVYRMVWVKLLHHPKWALNNKELLVKQVDPFVTTITREVLFLECSIVHMDFLLGQDKEAFDRLQSISAYLQDEPLVWLHLLKESKQWSRLLAWLTFLTPLIAQGDDDLINFLLLDWVFYMEQTKETAGYEKALKLLLPTSLPYYEYYLLEEKRYKEYIELQLYIQLHPSEWDGMELKVVEKDDIHHLLPLYHQSIDRLILERNRPAYKLAVRLLKKLQSYYKRLKLQEQWGNYVYALATHNSRLSALKEEMRKGKLIQ